MSYRKPNWILLKECGEKLTKEGKVPFTRKQLIDCVHEKYSGRGEKTKPPEAQKGAHAGLLTGKVRVTQDDTGSLKC